jgi:hypothetical protein
MGKHGKNHWNIMGSSPKNGGLWSSIGRTSKYREHDWHITENHWNMIRNIWENIGKHGKNHWKIIGSSPKYGGLWRTFKS